jgi:hypothetical protein
MVLCTFQREPNNPFSCKGIHQNIEQLCRQWAALGHALVGLKRHAVVSRCTSYHLRLVPKMANELPHVGSCPVPLQHIQAVVPIHCIKHLLQIQEDAKKWRLLQVGKLLGQFGLNNDCPGAVAAPASM